MFSEKDLQQIAKKGISLENINQQIENFKNDFPPAELIAPATINDGLINFSEEEVDAMIKNYEASIADKSVLKFVPASGAASRMFKHLFAFRDQYTPEKEDELFEDKSFNSVHHFFANLRRFAFHNDLKTLLKEQGEEWEKLYHGKEYIKLINALLNEDGLNYANLPKGLLKFHNYHEGARMSVEEHLVEGCIYGRDKQGNVKIHFTVSPEHLEKFKMAIKKTAPKYEKKYGVKINVSYSVQKSSTDMIAVDMQNKPFRDENGLLVFRPGGHGSLIENLNELNEDIIFIKNIDNIVPDRLREKTYIYKKVLASYLIELQTKTFAYLQKIEKGSTPALLDEIEKFATEKLMIRLPEKFKTDNERKTILFNKLNRPIRTCGMVKNEGEPGGGPFWVKNSKGETSLQIVESSQINLSKTDQKEIVQQATHFNPVDLVCGIKDFKGNKFDLTKFVDANTGFISEKSQNGKTLKAQELPGLWNGSMADWITVFIECPIITFNPVKTINDLLREQHQETIW